MNQNDRSSKSDAKQTHKTLIAYYTNIEVCLELLIGSWSIVCWKQFEFALWEIELDSGEDCD